MLSGWRHIPHIGVTKPFLAAGDEAVAARVDDGFADRGGLTEPTDAIEGRQRATFACVRMCLKERRSKRALGNLDRGRPARIHLQNKRESVPRDEVDPV